MPDDFDDYEKIGEYERRERGEIYRRKDDGGSGGGPSIIGIIIASIILLYLLCKTC